MNPDTNLKRNQVFEQPTMTGLAQKKLDNIGQTFLALWQQAHGTAQGAVKVMVGQTGLMLLLENAFCKAELALAQEKKDDLLQQYIENLVDQVLPVLIDQIEVEINQSVKANSITANISQDWIMVFLQFHPGDQPQTASEKYQAQHSAEEIQPPASKSNSIQADMQTVSHQS